MSRKVFVSSDIAHDEALLEVAAEDPTAALLWPWLLTAFDDWGRARADARRLKAQLWPGIDTITVPVIEAALKLFAANGLVELYEDAGTSLMAIDEDKWRRFQTHIRWDRKGKEATSPIPAPSGQSPVTVPAQNGQVPGNSVPSPSPSLVPTERVKPSDEEVDTQINRGGVWTAMEDLFGKAATKLERSNRGRVQKSLVGAGATYTAVKERAKVWPKLFPVRPGEPAIRLTDNALEKWWGALGLILETVGVEAKPCQVCDSRRIVGLTKDGEVVKVDDPRVVANDRCVCVA